MSVNNILYCGSNEQITAEKGFWNFNESDDEKDPIRFVVRGDDNNVWIKNPDELSPKPATALRYDQQPLTQSQHRPSSVRSSPPMSLASKSLAPNESTTSIDRVQEDQVGENEPDNDSQQKKRPEDLDRAAGVERTQHILIDLSLDDAKFQFIAPSWADVVGWVTQFIVPYAYISQALTPMISMADQYPRSSHPKTRPFS